MTSSRTEVAKAEKKAEKIGHEKRQRSRRFASAADVLSREEVRCQRFLR